MTVDESLEKTHLWSFTVEGRIYLHELLHELFYPNGLSFANVRAVRTPVCYRYGLKDTQAEFLMESAEIPLIIGQRAQDGTGWVVSEVMIRDVTESMVDK